MRLAGVGDNVVDRYLDLGTWYPGGQALNVAVHAHRAGLQTAYVGVLGDDAAGAHVRQAIRAEGVDDSHVRVAHGPNGYADVVLVEGNRRFVRSDPGVSKFFLTDDDLAWLSRFDLVHSSASSHLEDQLGVLAAVTLLSYDFSVRRDLGYVDSILPHVTVATFSLSGLDDSKTEAWLERACRRGPRWALATRGAEDAIVFDGQRFWRQPTQATEVVDTLGAGDAFISRFLVGMLRGEPCEATLAAAAGAAATICSSYGAFGYESSAVLPALPVSAGDTPELSVAQASSQMGTEQ